MSAAVFQRVVEAKTRTEAALVKLAAHGRMLADQLKEYDAYLAVHARFAVEERGDVQQDSGEPVVAREGDHPGCPDPAPAESSDPEAPAAEADTAPEVPASADDYAAARDVAEPEHKTPPQIIHENIPAPALAERPRQMLAYLHRLANEGRPLPRWSEISQESGVPKGSLMAALFGLQKKGLVTVSRGDAEIITSVTLVDRGAIIPRGLVLGTRPVRAAPSIAVENRDTPAPEPAPAAELDPEVARLPARKKGGGAHRREPEHKPRPQSVMASPADDPWTDSQVETLRRFWGEKMSFDSIRRSVNKTPYRVRAKAAELGLGARPEGVG